MIGDAEPGDAVAAVQKPVVIEQRELVDGAIGQRLPAGLGGGAAHSQRGPKADFMLRVECIGDLEPHLAQKRRDGVLPEVRVPHPVPDGAEAEIRVPIGRAEQADGHKALLLDLLVAKAGRATVQIVQAVAAADLRRCPCSR